MQNSMYYTNSGLTSLPEYQGGGYIDQYGRQRYGFGKLVRKITKPIAKVLDKVVPNEIKPILPYAAAFAPFMFPGFTAGLGSMLGGSGTIAGLSIPQMIGSGVLKAGADLAQEGAAERGLNPLSLGATMISAGLATPGSFDSIGGGQIIGNVGEKVITAGDLSNLGTSLSSNVGPEAIRGLSLTEGSNIYNALQGAPITSPTMLQQGQNLITSGLQSGAKFLEVPEGGVSFLNDPLRAAKTLVTPAITTAGEQAYNAALDAQKKYQNELLAMGNLASSNKQDQINYIRRAMVSAGFNEDEISSAITRSGFMYGGRVGYGLGSFVKGNVVKPAMQNLKKMKNKVVDFISRMTDDIEIRTQTDYADDSGASFDIYITPKTEKGRNTLDQISQMGLAEKQSDGIYFINDINLEEATMSLNERGVKASGVYEPTVKGEEFESFRTAGQGPYGADYYGYDRLKEGLRGPKRPPMDEVDYNTIPSPTDKPEGFADGGLMNLRMGGMPAEMDLRKGGFVPLGKKERADDVPARLSKNEFVFTAKAVRNAGGGDVRKGAKRMYQIMNQLEART